MKTGLDHAVAIRAAAKVLADAVIAAEKDGFEVNPPWFRYFGVARVDYRLKGEQNWVVVKRETF